jgi:hypothetical protein
LVHLRGSPGIARAAVRAYDATTAEQLWGLSAQLTSIDWGHPPVSIDVKAV